MPCTSAVRATGSTSITPSKACTSSPGRGRPRARAGTGWTSSWPVVPADPGGWRRTAARAPPPGRDSRSTRRQDLDGAGWLDGRRRWRGRSRTEKLPRHAPPSRRSPASFGPAGRDSSPGRLGRLGRSPGSPQVGGGQGAPGPPALGHRRGGPAARLVFLAMVGRQSPPDAQVGRREGVGLAEAEGEIVGRPVPQPREGGERGHQLIERDAAVQAHVALGDRLGRRPRPPAAGPRSGPVPTGRRPPAPPGPGRCATGP